MKVKRGPPPNLQAGNIVFFKRAKDTSSVKAPWVEFKGHGFGVVLGHLPPFQKDPAPGQLFQMMGMIGYLLFDDVAEFLGDEQAKLCIQKFQDKYYPKKTEAEKAAALAAAAAPEAPEPSKIVGLNGQPLIT